MMTLTRPVQLDDAPALAHIEAQVQPHGWSETDFTQTLQQHANGIVLLNPKQAANSSNIIGFCLWQQILDEVSLLNIAIHPNHQRQGFGRELVKKMLHNSQEHQAAHIFLEVRRSNTAAIALYEQLNFIEMGIRRNYYRTQNGKEDAILMGYSL